MGGIKRKIKIEKIEKKSVKSVTFTKRRNGLFRKASELCLVSPATQIAILATPPSSNSHASFYSFGHSSVEHVVSSLLHDLSPPSTNQDNKSGLGFWWEDELAFDRSENVDELKDATDAVTRMLNNVRLRLDAVKSNQREGGLVVHQDQEDLQRPTTETNNNEDTTKQITEFGGTSGIEFLLEDEEENILTVDDYLTDVNIDPLFLIR